MYHPENPSHTSNRLQTISRWIDAAPLEKYPREMIEDLEQNIGVVDQFFTRLSVAFHYVLDLALAAHDTSLDRLGPEAAPLFMLGRTWAFPAYMEAYGVLGALTGADSVFEAAIIDEGSGTRELLGVRDLVGVRDPRLPQNCLFIRAEDLTEPKLTFNEWVRR